ncbi:LysR substrate-binding domain-containing protein [Vibrio hannami]|uniref:LysR substrate-binding domain-containing protein n=1 Tax=Vibrio hannami TaxID=2717094 RepID=UPI00240FE786|nr:LysR substrate-binding domain-containing protein [Vibrio hannami]MDG3085393.1 LysR substrate-binding domain-containing protein [Vibrio hannami]
MRTLVPLKSIYAFVAVAETGSMTEAAAVLNVSHSAVSQSIKSLENQLGTSLFRRVGRRVELNTVGRKYYRKVAPALEQIVGASEELQQPANPNRLNVNMVASLAMHWWIPRVQHFQEMAPNLDIRISNIIGPFNMEKEDVDVTLVHGVPDEWENYYCDKLGDDELVLVCHPDIVTNDISLNELLKTYPAIYANNERRKEDWKNWCRENKVYVPNRRNSLSFTSSLQGLQAAKRKLGVFVTHRLFVKDDVEHGLLAEVGKPVLNPNQSFYFACPTGNLKMESVLALRTWLHKEFDRNSKSSK